MKKVVNKIVTVAKNPTFRPFEIWALRAIVAYVAVKLGIDVSQVAK